MAHLAVLALYTQLLTYAIQFLHVDTSGTVHKWASYSVAIAAIRKFAARRFVHALSISDLAS